jgi:DNA-binding transcriptional LysR family regulator
MFTLLNLVRAGIGVVLVPHSARQMRVNGINFGHIRSRQAEWDIAVAWNRLHESTLVRNFVNICLEHACSFRADSLC